MDNEKKNCLNCGEPITGEGIPCSIDGCDSVICEECEEVCGPVECPDCYFNYNSDSDDD